MDFKRDSLFKKFSTLPCPLSDRSNPWNIKLIWYVLTVHWILPPHFSNTAQTCNTFCQGNDELAVLFISRYVPCYEPCLALFHADKRFLNCSFSSVIVNIVSTQGWLLSILPSPCSVMARKLASTAMFHGCAQTTKNCMYSSWASSKSRVLELNVYIHRTV